MADLCRRCVAVHHRHLQVHQHSVEGGCGRGHRSHSKLTVAGQCDGGTFVFEQFLGDLLVVQVVFDHQQPHAAEPFDADQRWPVDGCGVGQRDACVGHSVEQHRRRDRLDKEAVQQRLLLRAALGQHLAAVGGDHDDERGFANAWNLTQSQAGSPAVQVGHLPVDQHHLVGAAIGSAGFGQGDGLGAAGRHIGLPAERAHHAGQQRARAGVVVHDQGLQRAQVGR